ncbi:MAG: flagellar biosynthetic protein FliR [Paracoccaceae bacterium]
MIELNNVFWDLTSDWIEHGSFVFLRVSGLVLIMPLFSSPEVPVRVRLSIAIAYTFVISNIIPITAKATSFVDFSWMAVLEISAGAILGISLRLFVMSLQICGSIIGQSVSLSQILGTAGADPVPAMGQVLVVAGAALSVQAGLHVKLAELLLFSYEFMPFGRLPDAETLTTWGVGHVSKAFALGFSLAAPFVAMAIVYNLALGAINKAMPQLMVAFVGAPFIILCGLVLFALAAPVMLEIWHQSFLEFVADPSRIAK